MPDFMLTFNGEPVGRVSLATDLFVDRVSQAMLKGVRFELSGAFINKPESQTKLVELVLSPLPTSGPPKATP